MHSVRLLYLLGLILIAGATNAFAQQPPASAPGPQEPLTPIPVLTDEDRAAAFPHVAGHAAHDRKVNYFLLFNHLEWRNHDEESTVSWDNIGWVGGDVNRLWFRTEGEGERRRVHEAEAHLLYGRAFSRWWDFVAGVRQDFRPGPAQTWAAVGIQGLAPSFFEVEATAYIGASGRAEARLEAEHELLITNRLILQPRGEINFSGKSDPRRGIGSGLSTTEAGLRLRYEFRREFAPYIGFMWKQKFGRTADFARTEEEQAGRSFFTAGIRLWF